MLTEVEAMELRALQHRAYGRGGALTEADAARLRELEARRIVPTPEPPADPVPADDPAAEPEPTVDATTPTGDLSDTGDREEPVVSGDVSDLVPAAAPLAERGRARLRTAFATVASQPWARRPRVIVGALIGALLLAFALGAALPRTPVVALPESPEQQDRRAAILEQFEDFDPESLILIDEEGDATLWYATSLQGKVWCGVIDNGTSSQQQCANPENGRLTGLQLFFGGEGNETSYYGGISFTRDDLPLGTLAAMSGYRMTSPDLLTEEERRFADALVAEGYAPDARVLGYLEDEPIWLGYYGQMSVPCLLYDDPLGEMQVSCDEVPGVVDTTSRGGAAGPDARLPISFQTVSAKTGESVLVELFTSDDGAFSLTITRSADHPPTAWGPRIE